MRKPSVCSPGAAPQNVDSSSESVQLQPTPLPAAAQTAETKEAATLIVASGGDVSHEEGEEEEEEEEEDGEDEDEEEEEVDDDDDDDDHDDDDDGGGVGGEKEKEKVEEGGGGESEHSSDFDQTASPVARSSSHKATDLSLNPLSPNIRDSSAQPADRIPNSMKRSAAFPDLDSEEKRRRTAAGVGVEGGLEKKNIFKRIWSNEDELMLVKSILDYTECHHIFPSTQVHLESLLMSIKDSLSISVTLNQMNEKIRRIKKKYKNTARRVSGANNPKFSNAHDATVFYLSRKIWDSTKEKPIFLQNKTSPKKMEDTKSEKIGGQQSREEYPSILRFVERGHSNIPLVLTLNHIPVAKAKELEGEFKKLEIPETKLFVQKVKLLGDALKLIQDALDSSAVAGDLCKDPVDSWRVDRCDLCILEGQKSIFKDFLPISRVLDEDNIFSAGTITSSFLHA